MNPRATLRTALQSAWIILKYVIPISILADVLFYYHLLEKVAFLLEPFTGILGLPPEAALSLISGMLLNLYAAVAFAAPLDMDPHQWSVLAIFLGICHALIVENAIMKQLGISNRYAYALRIGGGLAVGAIAAQMPSAWFEATVTAQSFSMPQAYTGLGELLSHSFYRAVILSAKLIVLITVLVFVMDWIKSLPLVRNSARNVSKGFTITVGILLGITYGAGMLIKEKQSGDLSRRDVFYIGTFLMISHAMIEDPLLFAIFGADVGMVIAIRMVAAVVIATVLLWLYGRLNRPHMF
jgi:hypothetical protein